jgi:2-dehydro-3-deoxy-D-arabinonate dehydratase
MNLELADLGELPALVRVKQSGRTVTALWRGGRLLDLAPRGFDELLAMPLAEARSALESAAGLELDPAGLDLAAPVMNQEVWAAGVTYLRSQEARLDESEVKDVYSRVYRADRPEVFFKTAGWRVVPHRGQVGVRSDSSWDTPEPELAVLANRYGEVLAYSCGNDMTSRSIEAENPLYLPQAKTYDGSCSIGPVAVLAWHAPNIEEAGLRMSIDRAGVRIFEGASSIDRIVRDPAQLVRVVQAVYQLPVGAWVLTGTSIVPGADYTALAGDVVRISIDGLGELVNQVVSIPHSGASALPTWQGRA